LTAGFLKWQNPSQIPSPERAVVMGICDDLMALKASEGWCKATQETWEIPHFRLIFSAASHAYVHVPIDHTCSLQNLVL
jgi:hypothetical protein